MIDLAAMARIWGWPFTSLVYDAARKHAAEPDINLVFAYAIKLLAESKAEANAGTVHLPAIYMRTHDGAWHKTLETFPTQGRKACTGVLLAAFEFATFAELSVRLAEGRITVCAECGKFEV